MSMKLLLLLTENAPRTTTRDEIVDRLWGGRIVTEDAINKQISKLRAALGDNGTAPRIIQTVHKSGVRLLVPVERHVAIAASVARTTNGGLLVGMVAVAIALLAVIALPTRQHGDAELVQEPVTALPGSEMEPALSPAGDWLAYVARTDGDQAFNLFVRRVGSENAARITPPDADARVPAWSPDGRLAFVLRTPQGCVIAVGSRSGRYRAVTRCTAAETGGISWLDSQRLLISDRPGVGRSHQLDILDLRDGSRTLLVDPPAGDVGDLHPLVSADRKRVYFLRNKSVGPSELFSVSLAHRAVTQLTRDGAAINGLANGSGGNLLLSSQRGGRGFSLWSFDPGRSEWKRLLPNPATGLTTSIDGRLGVFSKTDRQTGLWQMPLQGGEGRAVAMSTGIDWSPALSPGERQLAFLSNRSGDWEIWILDRPSGSVRRLSQFGGPEVQDLHWSRDGRTIATSVARQGQFDIHLLDLRDGATRRVAATSLDERQPIFTPDGQTLWFVRRSGAKFQLRSYDLSSGREVSLLNGVMRALPSLDGKQAYFVRPFEDGLWRADMSTKSVRKIALWPDASRMRNVDVSGSGVWATALKADGRAEIVEFALHGGHSRVIRTLPDLARPSGIAVAGNEVIYARRRRDEADLTMIRFER